MVALLLVLFLNSKIFAADIINAKKLFDIEVENPSHLTECLNKIWVFSAQEKSFYVFKKENGQKIAQLKLNESVSALGCTKSQLIIATSNSGIKTFELDENIKLKKLKFFKIPHQGQITDLQCNESNCYLVVAGFVYKTSDLRHWIQIKVRTYDNITHNSIDTSTNPFDDWQEKLQKTKGKITKVLPLDSGRLALLDPFRANILINDRDQWSRWGNWGVWEGKFLAPKAFSYSFSKMIFVSDPHLKAISVFTDDGKYLGVLGEHSNFLDISYPTEIYFNDDILYIIDFFKSKFQGFEVSSYAIKKSHLNDTKADRQFRYNLFRREDVIKDREKNRCLLCHDGTLRDDKTKYINSHKQHPVKTTCTECHDPHHIKILKKPQQELCMSCHKEHVKMGHKADRCTDCHSAHHGVEKTLKRQMPSLCINCHQFKKFEHRATEHMMSLENAKGIKFINNKISCTTCHVSHGQKVKPESIMPFCANCHGQKADMLFKNFHKRQAHK